MPFPNFVHLTNASPGATRNSGTNGDLCVLFDWALPQAGWTIEFSSGNARVYRPPSGNRFRLHVNHDSAVSGAAQRAVVRGCESASGATTLVDPFPLTTQVADTSANWIVSSLANTTDRPFRILVWESGLIYLSQFNGAGWDAGVFIDAPATRSSDSWNTYCSCRNSTSNTATAWLNQNPFPVGGTGLSGFFARTYDGTVKSSRAMLVAATSPLGVAVGAWASAGSGPDGEIDSDPIGISCTGSQSATISAAGIIRRAWLPQMRNPLTSGIGAFDSTTTFTNTAYDPTALFRLINATTAAYIVLEESNTFKVPSY